MARRKYLKDLEMVKLDLFNEKIRSKKYEVEIMKLKGREVQHEIDKLAIELQREKDKLKDFTSEIKKQFKISTNNWGYDPITGEVKCE